MYRIEKNLSGVTEIEKSRFICYLSRVFSESEARAYIETIRKQHADATHVCYAFICGEHDQIQRSNDAGEPSGSAGVPILECLKKQQMSDTIAIVVRYFGGIKLGLGGLIRAYGGCVSDTLDKAVLTRKVKAYRYRITFNYDLIGKLDYYLNQHDIEILDKDYDEKVTYIIQSEENPEDDLREISSGTLEQTLVNEIIIEKRK